MSLSLNYPFDNPGNYIYDSNEILIAEGEQQLKEQRSPDASFYASYENNIDGDYGNGVLTGTPVGGASILNGKLDIAHGDIRYVDYDADLNADSEQVGCVRIKIIPNYDNNPGTFNQYLFTISDTTNKNQITIYHASGGQIYLLVNNSAGVPLMSVNLGLWIAVLGTTYEFELNWDITTGATRLFINGVQFGTTQFVTGTRDANIVFLRVGSNFGATAYSNIYVEDILIFSVVQHTANYTPVVYNRYSISNPSTIFNGIFRTDMLISITETSTKTGSDEIKYILRKNGVNYYHDGNSWTISNGTYSQANTAIEINANAVTFTIVPVNVQILDFKHSDNGTSTPILSNVKITYDFAGDLPSLTEVTIWSFLRSLDSPLSGVEIKVRPVWVIGDTTIITGDFITQTTNGDGYFKFDMLVEDVDPTYLEWNIRDKIYKTNFINQSIVKFSELSILWQNETDIDLLGV